MAKARRDDDQSTDRLPVLDRGGLTEVQVEPWEQRSPYPIVCISQTRFYNIRMTTAKLRLEQYAMEIVKNLGGLLRAQVTSAMPDGGPETSALQGR